jgi:hypothetical protein
LCIDRPASPLPSSSISLLYGNLAKLFRSKLIPRPFSKIMSCLITPCVLSSWSQIPIYTVHHFILSNTLSKIVPPPTVISIRLAAHPGSQGTVLVYDFVACKAPSAAEHAEKKTEREVSNHRNEECNINCAHRQLHCRPSQDPSTPASRPLRQVAVAGPRACASQTQDNADTSYPNT